MFSWVETRHADGRPRNLTNLTISLRIEPSVTDDLSFKFLDSSAHFGTEKKILKKTLADLGNQQKLRFGEQVQNALYG